MIGKVYKSIVPYYDRVTRSQRFKARPCLIIGQADSSDYVVLPISSISERRRVNPEYDIFLDENKYDFLSKDSYLRTNKQTIVNVASLKNQLSDFKNQYEETYIEVLEKVEKFQNELIRRAI